MFQRLHGKSELDGTGIALSIVWKVGETCNGFIWAYREVGQDALFILLPAEL